MSWSEMRRSGRRAFLRAGALAAVLGLGGCFRPMLAEDAPGRALRGLVALPELDSRFGYYLRQGLEDRLGAAEAPRWRLEIDAVLNEDDLAITPDSAITRKSLTARAEYRLVPVGGGAPVLEGSVMSQSGYNATGSLYATRAVARDTEERLARDLGLRIGRRVLAAAERLERS